MRSFTAILRISREQVEARGEFGVNRFVFFLCFGLTIVAAVATLLLPEPGRSIALKFTIGFLVAASIFAAGLAKSRNHARRNLAQVDAIRDVTVDALLVIAKEKEFNPKPLDFTQRLYLTELLKKTKRQAPELSAVLNLSE